LLFEVPPPLRRSLLQRAQHALPNQMKDAPETSLLLEGAAFLVIAALILLMVGERYGATWWQRWQRQWRRVNNDDD
jgi:hypothetical protein